LEIFFAIHFPPKIATLTFDITASAPRLSMPFEEAVPFNTPKVAKKQPLLEFKIASFFSALFELGHFARIFSAGIAVAE
jgi:hypothetical protein